MRQRLRRLAVAGAVVLGFGAAGALLAAFAWAALKPFRVAAARVWEFIPAGARPGLAITAGVLLVLFVVLCFVVKVEPGRSRRSRRGTFAGVDSDVADLDDSAL